MRHRREGRRLEPSTHLSRRRVIAGSAALGLGASWLGAASRVFAEEAASWGPRPARVRGRVTAAGRGLGRVAVSDGLSTGATDAEGYFELVSDRRARFGSISLPDGYRIPQRDTGTARLYEPLRFDADDEAAIRFELEPSPESDDDHRFLAFGDTQLDEAADAVELHRRTVPHARRVAEEVGTAFGVTCGDLVDDSLELFTEYERAVTAIGVPFFQVVGNHDLDPAEGAVRGTIRFEERFGPTDYSFNRGGVHYVVLDDVLWLGEGYVGHLTERRLDWLASDLARVEAGATVVIFAHVPFLSTISERIGGKIAEDEARVTNRESIYELLDPFTAHLITSHTHDNEHLEHGGCSEHILGPICGAWWNGPIAWDGTPNGFHLFEARGGELSWRFHATGLPAETQLRLYAPGADPRRPQEYVANVWNWDSGWQVHWLEDGERRGPMQRARGLDPMAVSLYGGPNRPLENGEWVEPVLTDHLFYATASPTARSVGVEAVDRWGRSYRETVRVDVG